MRDGRVTTRDARQLEVSPQRHRAQAAREARRNPRAPALARRGYNISVKHLNTAAKRAFFSVLHSTRDAQAAMMTLRPGQSTSDEPENEHPRCEQWLFVLAGTGKAAVGKRRVALKANSLLLIEKGEPHQITNTGKSPLVTVNFYAPPAYTQSGDLKMMARVPTVRSMLPG